MTADTLTLRQTYSIATGESFDGANLSLFFGDNLVVASIVDADSKSCIAWELHELGGDPSDNWTHRVEAFLLDRKFLADKPWERITVSLITNGFALIPTEYFNPNAKLPYYRLNAPYVEGKDKLGYENINVFDSRLAFAYPLALKKVLNSFFPMDVEIGHIGSGILESVGLFKDKEESLSGISLHGNIMSAFALSRSSDLVFFNLFEVKSPMDVVYYSLLMFKSLGRDPRQSALKIWGIIDEEGDPVYKHLQKYFRTIQFGEESSSVELSRDFRELPSHLPFGTLTLS